MRSDNKRLQQLLLGPYYTVFDTGATKDNQNHTQELINKRTSVTQTIGATKGSGAVQHFNCSVPITKYDKNGKYEFTTILEECSYLPKNLFNLFAVNYYMDRDWEVYGNKHRGYVLKREEDVINFYIKINTKKSCLWATRMVPLKNESDRIRRREVSILAAEPGAERAKRRMNIMVAHEFFGHHDEAKTRPTAAANGI